MPAPTNISFATATDLGSLPASVMQTVDEAGTTYTVYYKFTAPVSAVVIGAWGFGDLTTYTPVIEPYDASEVSVLSVSLVNMPIQFPVTGGAQYYLKLIPNGGNPTPAVLTLNVQVAPNSAVPRGSIAVNDDTTGFPLALVPSTADNTVLKFVNGIASGEEGDTLESGIVLLNDNSNLELTLYAADYSVITGPVAVETGITGIRTHTPTQKFYAITSQNPPRYVTVTDAGVISTPVPLTGSGITTARGVAVNNAETILYFAKSTLAAPVQRWDIPGAAVLSDLAAAVGNSVIGDIIVLADDTILVGYSLAGNFTVLRYNAAGAVLNTYSMGAFVISIARLATALDDPDSFWVMQNNTGGTQTWTNVLVSDGSTVTQHTGQLYGAGEYVGTATATPRARFGTSPSCPFWITRFGATPVAQTFTDRRLRQFLLPSSPDNRMLFLGRLELLCQTGIGLPEGDAADPPVQGSDPQVMMQLSRDGGATWSPERWMSAGKLGEYTKRVRWLRNGRYRNAVCRIIVSDPVDWQFLAMSADIDEGSS